jgi:hypothetical protein
MTVDVVDAGPGRISRPVEVAAPLVAIAADPRRHQQLAEVTIGSKFSTNMKMYGVPYRITGRVTALEQAGDRQLRRLSSGGGRTGSHE